MMAHTCNPSYWYLKCPVCSYYSPRKLIEVHLAILGFELRASNLLHKCSTTWATSLVPQVSFELRLPWWEEEATTWEFRQKNARSGRGKQWLESCIHPCPRGGRCDRKARLWADLIGLWRGEGRTGFSQLDSSCVTERQKQLSRATPCLRGQEFRVYWML
jgi:hypothetical protein